MKKTEFKTKNKQRNEANASEAEDLINEYLESFDRNSNLKTKKILDEYLETKSVVAQDHSSSTRDDLGSENFDEDSW